MQFVDYGNPETTLDRSIGKIVFKANEWGPIGENGEYVEKYTEIPSHNCSPEEIGLKGDSSKFFPISKDSKGILDQYNKNFICIDPKDMRIYGDFNSDSARRINIQLVKCSGHQYCKSDAEITKALRGKYILLFYNQIYFNNAAY